MLKLAIVATVLAGCSLTPQPSQTTTPVLLPSETASGTPAATPDAWASLFRPLRVPAIDPQESCPTTASIDRLENIGPILGDGPIYPAFLGRDGVFSLGTSVSGNEPRLIDGNEWWGKKTLWLSDDTYQGIALVRGGRVDQAGELLFYPGSGSEYVDALRLTVEAWVYGGSPEGWREWNGGVFYREPGCYAFQIDGEDFSEIIVVAATR